MVRTEIGISSGNFDVMEILLRGPDTWNQWCKEHPTQEINLRNAYLKGADLSNANLNSADLSGAYLKGADLNNSDLSEANLHDAILSNAILRNEVQLAQNNYLTGDNLRVNSILDSTQNH